ncbi:MAG: peptide chain release factor 2 [Anaerolineae bacterium]|nr:peptide chain release factor 2 [Anaerolineae bacterium]
MEETANRLSELKSKLDHIRGRLDLDDKGKEILELEKRAAQPDFWGISDSAQTTMRRIAELREEVDLWNSLEQRADDALELSELADESLEDELRAESDVLGSEVDRLEFRLLFSGPYDRGGVILAIHSGAGGIDAQEWAEMMMRMYLRWAEVRGFKADVVDMAPGEEAGIKRAMIAIDGRYAFGYARAERGVHRLVRMSPFDSAHRRHTSFALVEAWPDLGDDVLVTIDPSDIAIDTFRASSAGGQHMQKNETAIRITHVPSGIVVSCQNERSQAQNREVAMRVLRARLLQAEEERRRVEIAELKGEHVEAGWGNQIRSYVLHPYQMVKDHRTDVETGNVQAVLDGRLDEFMEAYLRATIGSQ